MSSGSRGFPTVVRLLAKSFFIFVLAGVFGMAASGQGICVEETEKVSLFRGCVISPHGDAMPEVQIRLYKWKDRKKIVGETTTDILGKFAITRIRDGKYLAEVQREFFSTMAFPVRVNSRSTRSGTLLIHLAVGIDEPCASGGVELVL